jgi:hypothetical protein
MRRVLVISLALIVLPTTYAYADSNPYGISAIDPAGPNDVILTVSSPISTKKYRASELYSLAKSTLTINEPFVKKVQSFSVIPLSTLFTKSRITARSSVETKALNDYMYTNVAATFLAAKGYLAVKLNGKPIPYDQGGPIRIIYPNTSMWSKFLDPWNWSLISIVAK